MKKKRLCIITGSRSEWGLFYPLAADIRKNRDVFTLQIIATGAHLSPEFGLTYKEIMKDGFRIDYKARMLQSKDTAEAILGSVSAGMREIAKGLKLLKPDLVFLLGDRFETFSAAAACLFLKIPIAHIHGGELTIGSLDDSLRHSITKMSYLHFVATDTYRKRVIQMGEEPARVFKVGALGLDNIRDTKLLGKKELEKAIKFKLGKKNIMVTFNPSTAEGKSVAETHIRNLLKAVDELPDTSIILTKSNPDMYSKTITGLLNKYVTGNKGKVIFLTSMGRRLYLSALQFMDVVAGNSSSGIIEVPSFGIPTVNIGNRQEGRVKPISVIDAAGSYIAIKRAFEKAFSRDFRKLCRETKNPHGDGFTAPRITNIVLKNIDKIKTPKKNFYDIKVE